VNGHAQHAFWIVIDLVLGKSPFERFHLDWEKPPPILPGFPIDRGGAAVIFVANFRHLATPKKGPANLTKEILGIKKNPPYFEEKSLEVARTWQDSKKDLLVHEDSSHLWLINAEDPSQCTYLRNLKKKTLGGGDEL
jgi:hypothetical protein